MKDNKITDTIYYIGADDKTLDLFESQYIIPNGVSYNSYLIFDKDITIMDTVDARATERWLDNLQKALNGKKPKYLVISHMEPDHAASIQRVCERYSELKLVGNVKTFSMLGQFYDVDFKDRFITVKEGEILDIGNHKLKFIMAPMVHWPEVMVTYDSLEKVLFSADAFGKFGTLDTKEDWTCEARRYYFNIVGKYGQQVQALLKKASGLDIQMICPLHGPILNDNLSYYLSKYDIWSKYEPEDEGVFIAYASIHGNTAKAAKKLYEILKEKGAKVSIADLSRDDMAEAVEDAFRYSKLVVASATYDAGLFPCMEDFLNHLKAKNYQNRIAAVIENGSWAPMAGKHIKNAFETMKNITVIQPEITIKSTVKSSTIEELKKLADKLL